MARWRCGRWVGRGRRNPALPLSAVDYTEPDVFERLPQRASELGCPNHRRHGGTIRQRQISHVDYLAAVERGIGLLARKAPRDREYLVIL